MLSRTITGANRQFRGDGGGGETNPGQVRQIWVASVAVTAVASMILLIAWPRTSRTSCWHAA